jgi:type II secretory pathway pseudopilin PulG
MLFYKSHAPTPRAFGLVELMVSISIMTLVTTVVLVRQSSFNGAVLLRNQAYEVAFTIRQAQLLAVSGKDVTRRYGVHFSNAGGLNQQYFMFADNGNGYYQTGEEIGQIGRLDRRFIVRDLFIGTDGSPVNFSIVFERPNFDARVCTAANTCQTEVVFIDIAKNDGSLTAMGAGDVRRVQVSSAGEISVGKY